MERHLKDTTGINGKKIGGREIDGQVNFDREVEKAHRELKTELERLKLQNKINLHIGKILDRKLTEIKK